MKLKCDDCDGEGKTSITYAEAGVGNMSNESAMSMAGETHSVVECGSCGGTGKIDDGLPSNKDKAEWAMGALRRFNELCPGDLSDDPADIRMVAGDLIADIFHLLQSKKISPASVVSEAATYYEYEKGEEE
jgi:hypothetical protein